VIPAKGVVGEEPDDDERSAERDEPDRERSPPFAAELWNIDLCPGQEGQHDAGEGAEEGEPARDGEREGVPDDEARRQLDQGDRETDLDREHRRRENRCRKECCYREIAQGSTS
jgi:hypothetical protein